MLLEHSLWNSLRDADGSGWFHGSSTEINKRAVVIGLKPRVSCCRSHTPQHLSTALVRYLLNVSKSWLRMDHSVGIMVFIIIKLGCLILQELGGSFVLEHMGWRVGRIEAVRIFLNCVAAQMAAAIPMVNLEPLSDIRAGVEVERVVLWLLLGPTLFRMLPKGTTILLGWL